MPNTLEEVTLQELLNLSLGTPEIGAVNFNFLFEVIQEILKHLGISKKVARLTDEIDYRLQSEYRPENQGFTLEALQEESAPECPKSVENFEAPATPLPSTKADVEVVPAEIQPEAVKQRRVVNPLLPPKPMESKSPSPPPKPSPPSSARPMSAKAVRRRASLSPGTLEQRRTSNFERRPSLVDHINSNQDVALVNKALDRRDSKTPAGDMWHVLNINRRLEAAEATIQGITTLIDNVMSDLIDVKEVAKDLKDASSKPRPETPIDVKEDASQVEKLAAELKKMKEEFKEAAKRSDLTNLCSIALAEDLIDERIQCLPSGENVVTKKRSSRGKLTNELLSKVMQLEESQSFLSKQMEELNNQLQAEVNKPQQESVSSEEVRLLSEKLEGNCEATDKNFKATQELKLNAEKIQKSQAAIAEQAVRNERMASDNHDEIRKIVRSLEELSVTVNKKISSSFHRQPSFAKKDDEVTARLRANVAELQEKIAKIVESIQSLEQKLSRKSEAIDNLNDMYHCLEDSKVSKEFVEELLGTKADKRDLDTKASLSYIDTCIGGMDRTVQDLVQKVESNQSAFGQAFAKVENELVDKTHRSELETLRTYVENRFKSFKPKVEEPQNKEESAAGFRKPLLRNFHCISCDRPVDILQVGALPALPYSHPLPGGKAMRPYTTFDIEQIRQHMHKGCIGTNKERFDLAEEREKLQKEILQLCGVNDLDELATKTNRSCGGLHTLVDPHKKTMMKPALFYREEHNPFQPTEKQLMETEVLGRDGHIYKGRLDQLPPVQQKNEVKPVVSQRDRTSSPIIPRPSMQKSNSQVSSTGHTAKAIEQLVQ